MYKYLNNKYDNLSTKIKIELFILPLLLFYFLYYLFFNYYLENEILTYPKIQKNDFNKKFTGSYLELFSYLEYLSNQNKIFIKNLSKDKNYIFIEGYSQKESILIFLKDIENINNFTKIDSVVLNKKDDLENYNFELKLDLNRFYIKNFYKTEYKDFSSLENNSKPDKKKSFKMNAIVLNYAFINDNWIKKNEKIDDYELIQIGRDFVILRKEDDNIKVELLNE